MRNRNLNKVVFHLLLMMVVIVVLTLVLR